MARDIAQEIIDAVAGGAADYVVTKLVKEREEKISSQGLAGSVPTTEQILKTAYAKAGGGGSYSSSGGREVSGGGGSIDTAPATKPTTAPAETKKTIVEGIDPNGIVSVAGYDPGNYTQAQAGDGSKIAGYFVLGLVVVVILDKLMR